MSVIDALLFFTFTPFQLELLNENSTTCALVHYLLFFWVTVVLSRAFEAFHHLGPGTLEQYLILLIVLIFNQGAVS